MGRGEKEELYPHSALATEAASIAAPYAASVFGARLAGTPSNAWRICIHCGLLAPPPLVSTRWRGEAPSEASAAYLGEGRGGDTACGCSESWLG